MNYANEDIMKIINIIQQNIVDNGYKFSGEEHQYRKNCAPLLSDGTCFRASMRLFGMMMAGVHGYLDKKEYSYMDFYMSLDDSKTPEDNVINIEVNKDVESSIQAISLNTDGWGSCRQSQRDTQSAKGNRAFPQ